MKKPSLFALAFVVGFILSELVVGRLFGYPRYGVACYVEGLDYRNWDKSRVYQPYSRYMVNEGVNTGRVFSRNNLGFPGDDVSLEADYNVAVLGSSYIEAQQVDPEIIATSLLQQRLRLTDLRVNVINLGYRGGNPLNLYRRLTYWDQRLGFSKVLLVIDHYPYQNTANYANDMIIVHKSWLVDNNIVHNAYRMMRNSSSFINLMVPALSMLKNQEPAPPVKTTKEDGHVIDFRCLTQTIDLYDNIIPRLIIVSIVDLDSENQRIFDDYLSTLCRQKSIPYCLASFSRDEFRINGTGHFNEVGHRYLADALYKGYHNPQN